MADTWCARSLCWITIVRVDPATGKLKAHLWHVGENENFSTGRHIAFIVHPHNVTGGEGFSGAFDLNKPQLVRFLHIHTTAQPASSVNEQTEGNNISISGSMFFHIDLQSIVKACRGVRSSGIVLIVLAVLRAGEGWFSFGSDEADGLAPRTFKLMGLPATPLRRCE